MRFATLHKTDYEEVISINANMTVAVLKNNAYSSLAIIGKCKDDGGIKLKNKIELLDSSISVKNLDSIAYSVDGAKCMSSLNAAIIVGQVGYTKYSDLIDELQSLKIRDVDVIGIAIFE